MDDNAAQKIDKIIAKVPRTLFKGVSVFYKVETVWSHLFAFLKYFFEYSPGDAPEYRSDIVQYIWRAYLQFAYSKFQTDIRPMLGNVSRFICEPNLEDTHNVRGFFRKTWPNTVDMEADIDFWGVLSGKKIVNLRFKRKTWQPAYDTLASEHQPLASQKDAQIDQLRLVAEKQQKEIDDLKLLVSQKLATASSNDSTAN